MNGFIIGAAAALALATLTYFGFQFGAVTTAAKYTVPSVQLGTDPSIERVLE